MADFTIYLGNKNYSSWSLRPWLILKQTGVAFEEIVIPLYEPTSKATIMKYSPSGTVPALRHGKLVFGDSLAICEYLGESFPTFQLWPRDPDARAVARSVCAELHSGFQAFRAHLPMNVRSSFPKRFGEGKGEFLFGHFSIADASYAPVVTRFRTYKLELERDADTYCETIMALPAMQEWIAAARNEPMIIDKYEF